MTSLELAKVFGQRHDDVLQRLARIAVSSGGLGTCTESYYLNLQNKKQPMMIIDSRVALDFASSSRKENAPALLMQLMQKMIMQQHQPAIEEQAATIKQLKQELKDRPIKTIGMSSPVNRKSLHDQREELHDSGLCDKWTKQVRHCYYPVNALGKEKGYKNTGKGKNKTIDLNTVA